MKRAKDKADRHQLSFFIDVHSHDKDDRKVAYRYHAEKPGNGKTFCGLDTSLLKKRGEIVLGAAMQIVDCKTCKRGMESFWKSIFEDVIQEGIEAGIMEHTPVSNTGVNYEIEEGGK